MAEMNVHRVILGSKKVVVLREMKIKSQNLALKAVGNRAGDNQALLGSMMQQELLKILLVSIDGEKPSPNAVEDLDSLFSYQEYMQLMKVMGELMGGDSSGEYQIELGVG